MTRAQLSARLLAPLAWLLRKCGWLCVEPIEPQKQKEPWEVHGNVHYYCGDRIRPLVVKNEWRHVGDNANASPAIKPVKP